MANPSVAAVDPLLVGYVVTFGIAAIACFASVSRARQIDDVDTRRGLIGLLLTSGSWAAAHVGFFLAPTVELKLVFYQIGLFVGLSTVGPWLYFCSAYTGRSIHNSPSVRGAAIAVFVGLSLVKFTNPLHGLYFGWEVLFSPFPHLSIRAGMVHWLAMGLAYALAIVGYVMLFELFRQVGHDTKPLLGLVAITGLPLVLDILAEVSPAVINITYEPLGVAVFAVGVLFVFLDDFQSVRLAGDNDDPIIVLDDQDRVRDFNVAAREMFPSLETGQRIVELAPELAAYLDEDSEDVVIGIDHADRYRYYQLGNQPFGTDRTRLGRSITLIDVTERERYRRELERQNERLDQFASIVSHDLRNPLNVAQGRLELARKEGDSEHFEAVERAHDRMESLIADVLTLARQGQTIDERERVTLSRIAEGSWDVVDAGAASMVVESDCAFEADATRLGQLLENLFRNAIEHGGADVTIRVGTLPNGNGFYLADDGSGIPEDQRENVLESGYSTAPDGTGLGLSIVTEIVEAHGWRIDVADSTDGGARFEITGVDTTCAHPDQL